MTYHRRRPPTHSSPRRNHLWSAEEQEALLRPCLPASDELQNNLQSCAPLELNLKSRGFEFIRRESFCFPTSGLGSSKTVIMDEDALELKEECDLWETSSRVLQPMAGAVGSSWDINIFEEAVGCSNTKAVCNHSKDPKYEQLESHFTWLEESTLLDQRVVAYQRTSHTRSFGSSFWLS